MILGPRMILRRGTLLDAACLSGHLGKFLGGEEEFLGDNGPSAAFVGSGLHAVEGLLLEQTVGMDVEPSQSRALLGGNRQAVLPDQRENGVPTGAFLAIGEAFLSSTIPVMAKLVAVFVNKGFELVD